MSMSRYDHGGISGDAYDRNIFEASLSTVNKLQRDYWNAKQVIRKKLGKSDDDCIVASDAELDSKLELFRSVQTTCVDLINAVENYQNCVCALSRDENSMGRFLKDQGALDKTQAGKMMAAVGKSQCYTSQQRLALRNPLGRLHHDIETFRYRAVGDSVLSVSQMEDARTHYRASLRWMQDISSNLDPEQYKKLEKFRKVQNEVRLNKEKFDRLKWGVCQKVDLLCASRSNLFSSVLVPYQNELIKFWEKTAHTMAAVLENIKDYQHYEFKLLKGLNPIQDLDSDQKSDEEKKNDSEEGKNDNDQQLISLSDQEFADVDKTQDVFSALSMTNGNGDKDKEEDKNEDNENILLGDFEGTDFQKPSQEDLDLFNNILGEETKAETGDLETQWHSVFGEIMSQSSQAASKPNPTPTTSEVGDLMQTGGQDVNQTSGYLPSQLMDMMMSGTPSQTQMLQGMQHHPAMGIPQQNIHGPMMGMQPPSYNSMFANPPMGGVQQSMGSTAQGKVPQSKKDNKGNMAAWFNLFAELDPLQNPDALGKKKSEGKEKEGGGAGGAC